MDEDCGSFIPDFDATSGAPGVHASDSNPHGLGGVAGGTCGFGGQGGGGVVDDGGSGMGGVVGGRIDASYWVGHDGVSAEPSCEVDEEAAIGRVFGMKCETKEALFAA